MLTTEAMVAEAPKKKAPAASGAEKAALTIDYQDLWARQSADSDFRAAARSSSRIHEGAPSDPKRRGAFLERGASSDRRVQRKRGAARDGFHAHSQIVRLSQSVLWRRSSNVDC